MRLNTTNHKANPVAAWSPAYDATGRRHFLTTLPEAEHEASEWQAAMEAFILIARLCGPTMIARVMPELTAASNACLLRVRNGLGRRKLSGTNRSASWNHRNARGFSHYDSNARGTTMKILRLSLCFSLISFATPVPVAMAFGCGVGCHSTSQGACVRDGWQEGFPVRNECPATSMPTPPCGRYFRWSRHDMSCVSN
jgi:hypothetical protein